MKFARIMQYVALITLASLIATTSGDSCTAVNPPDRRDCGYPGINQQQCLTNASCCWDSSITGVKWCFIDPPRDPCNNQPCLHESTCTAIDGNTFTCTCTPGYTAHTCDTPIVTTTPVPTPPPTTTTSTTTTTTTTTTPVPTTTTPYRRPTRPYTLNVTADNQVKEVYFDGVKYTTYLTYYATWYMKDSASIASVPSIIAIAAYAGGGTYGLLASDSEGYVTDGTWKCTDQLYTNWFAASYDDSAWPAAVERYANGNRMSDVNVWYSNNWVKDISHRSNWIWSPVKNTATLMAYCRFHLPTTTSCSSSPCKNGGTCQPYNNAAKFWCLCPAGYSGPDCSQSTVVYQLYITANTYLRDVYIDGRLYDLTYPNNWKLKDTISTGFMPSLVAASGSGSSLQGILASDSTGRVSDSTWKCTKAYYTNWMMPDFDDSAWPPALLGSVNGDGLSDINYWNSYKPVDDISNRAFWVWAGDDDTKTYSYCRAHLSSTGNSCYSSPCKNGGTCTNVGSSFTCACPAGTTGPTCLIAGVSYQLNLTACQYMRGVFIDGIPYIDSLPKALDWNNKDTVQLNFLPSVIGYYAQFAGYAVGLLSSDTAGLVTDDSWKCTQYVHADWSLASYDDSAWPAATFIDLNGNRTSYANRYWNSRSPIPDISERAWWIWAADRNSTTKYDWVYCRLRVPAAGNGCFSLPCKNGGTCTNNGASFTCSCAAGFSGTQCDSPATTYQLNATCNNFIHSLYIDGVRYAIPNWNLWNVVGSLNLNYKPKQISVYAENDDNTYNGMILADTLGQLTGPGWKCTRYAYKDWMLVNFDDSSWPAAGLTAKSENAPINGWNGGKPVAGISLNAYWIWPIDFDHTFNYAYCRSPVYY